MASSRIQRWALTLGAYQYALCYKPGKSNLNADALSHLPSSYKLNVSPEPPEMVLSLTQLEKLESPSDPILSQVVQFVLKGWPTKFHINLILNLILTERLNSVLIKVAYCGGHK